MRPKSYFIMLVLPTILLAAIWFSSLKAAPAPDFSDKSTSKKADLSKPVSEQPAPKRSVKSGDSSSTKKKSTNSKDGSVLVWIPTGEFLMGSPEGEGDADERPVHKVKVEGFWLGKFEVTNKQYNAFLKESGYYHESDFNSDPNYNQPDQPVVGITRQDAQAYCKWAKLRLPTEAEWEYAASGGKQFKYPTATGQINHDLANYFGTGGKDRWEGPAPVGKFPPNPFGLYDLAGNAWEMTGSAYRNYPYSTTDGRETGEDRCLRVMRGGSWHLSSESCRTTYRHRFASWLRYDFSGFRVAK